MPSLCPEKAETTPHKASHASILVPAAGAFARHLAPADAHRAGGHTHRLASHATCVIYPNRSPEWIHHHDAPAPVAPTTQAQENPLEALGALLSPQSTGIPGNPGNAGNAWMGWLAYDLAASIEPGVLSRSTFPPDPLAMLQRVDLASHAPQTTAPNPHASPRTVLRSSQGREAYKRAVRRALEYIRAGDVYQANIAHQFTGRFSGSPAELFAALAGSADPVHGLGLIAPTASQSRPGRPAAPALPVSETIAVLSLSPELFLAYDAPTRRITTRPMKGTRPGNADPHELRDAEKDRAELAMIVDLMRNDLGRVCEFGSVQVDDPRAIERHASGPGAVLQATATVSGTVREGTTTADILAATFPPGSVTGTPKLRAMQIIDELEPFARGPYCGCLGLFHDNGSFELAVAIRTLVIRGTVKPGTDTFDDALLTYCVGAGIVADSDPESEWLETLDKARVLSTVFDIQTT